MALVENNHFAYVEDFFGWIARTFRDFNSVDTAQIKIKNCMQRNRPYMDYLNEFQMYIHETGYNDTMQKSAFYQGLSVEIKNYLVTMAWRDWDVVTLQEECARLENAYRSIQPLTSKFSRFTNEDTATPSILFFTPAASVSTPSPSSAGKAMDLSSKRVRHGYLTVAEKQARRDRGECLYCGGIGHFTGSCPDKPS